MKKSKTGLFVLSFVLSLFALEVYAGCCDEPSDTWQIKFIPYGWFAGADGDITAGGVTRSFDADFDDIFDKLNIGLMGRVEAWRNRWGITTDFLYLDLESESQIGPVTVDADSELFSLEFGGGYCVGKWPLGKTEAHKHIAFDALAGGRYTRIDNEIELGAPIGAKVSDDEDTVSPYIGGRVKVMISDRFSIAVRGDVGGFDVGDAELLGNLVVGLGYEITDIFSAKVGYRWFWIETENADIEISGPILGLGIRI
jgi:hypothetical protein